MSGTAVYIRQSEDKSGQEAAVQRQEASCRKYAEAKGWEAPEIYADNSVSASTGKRRPAFEQLVSDIERGTVTKLVVWHLDRLTRNMRDLTRVIEAGQEHRANIACVHGVSLDLGDPTGVAVAQILTAIASMEVKHKGNRQKAANRQRAEAGRAFWSRRPFGYDRDESGCVFAVEEEAALIRSGADQILSGVTLASVAREWNAAGYRTTDVRKDKQTGEVTKDGGPWGVTQVRRLMLNPRYAGKRIYNGEDMGAGEWGPVIDVDTHKRLEALLMDPRRRTAPDDLNAKYLLSGIAKCFKCGKPLYAAPYKNKGRSIMVYRCLGGYCLQRRMEPVDELITDVMVERLSRPDASRLFANSGQIAELRAAATDLRARRDALASLLADGLLSPTAVREQAAKISKSLTAIEAAISAAEGMNPLAAVIGSENVSAAWDALPLADKKQSLRALVEVTLLPAGKGVRFSPEHVRIEWKQLEG
ncbi:recombinase family protein [Pseudarthrobacter sp. NamB4]|uniref:recombinase family protein n=1 Tax=Pseudarthrobacter sp. NamB4 TaxID=2576837 RepID=UPI0010FD6D32|nr:recombinase family protein [Pseudarthrobacter sp. NamB4]TLM75963.1 recombinase family protein [Pseudarthrobacter sp. NamB4]